MKTSIALLVVLVSGTACGDDDDPFAESVDASTEPEVQAVTIPFAARVGGAPFECGGTYDGIGLASSEYVAIDFRFYLHDLELRRAGGDDYEPVTLDDDAAQEAGVALLDFEDASGPCEMGSATTHTAVTGTVAPGTYSGVRFKLGVPFDQNHLDPAAPIAPLDQSGMSWAWQFGYKFVKIDGTVAGEGFNLHLGSTGCPGDSFETPPAEPCANPNIPTVEMAFDPASDTIVADVATLLADVDVATNTTDTAPGCMSFPGDPECDTIFPKLGLPFGIIEAGPQALFAVE
jgi:uncharacterized repeat protein (TIGR04052 family)